MAFQIGGETHEFAFADMSVQPVTVDDVAVIFDEAEDRIEIQRHGMSVRYGSILIFVLEEAVLGTNLEALFLDGGLCDIIAEEIADRLNLPFVQGTIANYCVAGLERGLGPVLDRLDDLDRTAATLSLRGDAAAVGDADDRRVDRLSGGRWTGGLEVSDRESELRPEDNTFSAERIGP